MKYLARSRARRKEPTPYLRDRKTWRTRLRALRYWLRRERELHSPRRLAHKRS